MEMSCRRANSHANQTYSLCNEIKYNSHTIFVHFFVDFVIFMVGKEAPPPKKKRKRKKISAFSIFHLAVRRSPSVLCLGLAPQRQHGIYPGQDEFAHSKWMSENCSVIFFHTSYNYFWDACNITPQEAGEGGKVPLIITFFLTAERQVSSSHLMMVNIYIFFIYIQ